ncbi:MAG: hypothetical protein DME77_10210 [Verrucomicrobia bacterium]|nr:MAG: hypothetical protein DME77_10210 [Verrucomicrobiota bacterium]
MLFFSSFAEQRVDARQRQKHDEPDNKVRKFPAEPEKERESRQPKPARKRGHDSPAIEHPDRCQIEEI